MNRKINLFGRHDEKVQGKLDETIGQLEEELGIIIQVDYWDYEEDIRILANEIKNDVDSMVEKISFIDENLEPRDYLDCESDEEALSYYQFYDLVKEGVVEIKKFQEGLYERLEGNSEGYTWFTLIENIVTWMVFRYNEIGAYFRFDDEVESLRSTYWKICNNFGELDKITNFKI